MKGCEDGQSAAPEPKNTHLFAPIFYRSSNQDLRGLSDAACRTHFEQQGVRERRIFGPTFTSHDRLSMRWLRGSGIEIGPGETPTELYGESICSYADCDPALKAGGRGQFGGLSCDEFFSLDDPTLFERMPRKRFDFAIASHVLEHVDSFLLGFRNLIDMVRDGGICYVALPSSAYDYDKNWMPTFEFSHHIQEFEDPMKFVELHDRLVIEEHQKSGSWVGVNQIPPEARFPHHKHSYDFHGWCDLILRSLDFLGGPARLMDACFGYERMDCNFVLERSSEKPVRTQS
jgi:hypothetical protein